MAPATTQLQETWRYQGWLTSDEIVEDGAVDSAGNLILAGYTDRMEVGVEHNTSATDFQVVKVSGSMGVEMWTWTHVSARSRIDIINGVAVDSEDNVILGGYTERDWVGVNSNKQRNMTVVKLDGATGDTIWRYQNAADDRETSTTRFGYDAAIVEGVTVDADDNIFLVGTTTNDFVPSEGTANDFDWFVRKLDGETAAVLWTVREGSSDMLNNTKGIKTDSAGDVVIACYSGDDDSTMTVKKLSGAEGEVLWGFTRISTTTTTLSSVDVDGDGNVYVAGSEGVEDLRGNNAEHPIVLKIDGRSGDRIWYYSGDTTFPGKSMFHAVAVDPITGYVVGGGWLEEATAYDMVAVVLDSETGDELLVYQSGTTGSDEIRYAGFDQQGHLFFGGITDGEWSEAAGGSDFFAVKFETLQDSNMRVPTVTATPSPTLDPRSPAPHSSVSSAAQTLNSTKVAVIAGGELVFIFLLLSGLYLWCWRRRDKNVAGTDSENGSGADSERHEGETQQVPASQMAMAIDLPASAYETPNRHHPLALTTSQVPASPALVTPSCLRDGAILVQPPAYVEYKDAEP